MKQTEPHSVCSDKHSGSQLKQTEPHLVSSGNHSGSQLKQTEPQLSNNESISSDSNKEKNGGSPLKGVISKITSGFRKSMQSGKKASSSQEMSTDDESHLDAQRCNTDSPESPMESRTTSKRKREDSFLTPGDPKPQRGRGRSASRDRGKKDRQRSPARGRSMSREGAPSVSPGAPVRTFRSRDQPSRR